MAVFKPESLLSQYHRWEIGPKGRKVIQWSLDARRLLILGKRIDFRDPRQSPLFNKSPIEPFARNTNTHSVIDPYRDQMKTQKQNIIEGPTSLTQLNIPDSKLHDIVNDGVAIIDLDYGGYNKGYRIIKLPFIPKELSYNTESHFATIKPMGRNTPLYHFTGAEDKLEFDIDWYSFEAHRNDVIQNCRGIEALTKNDGYDGKPHRVHLLWGSDDRLFRDHTFVVLAAPYKMNQFSKGHLDKHHGVVKTAMMPVQAMQKVTLARISDVNLSHKNLEKVIAV